jgi:hypothetical protein
MIYGLAVFSVIPQLQPNAPFLFLPVAGLIAAIRASILPWNLHAKASRMVDLYLARFCCTFRNQTRRHLFGRLRLPVFLPLTILPPVYSYYAAHLAVYSLLSTN